MKSEVGPGEHVAMNAARTLCAGALTAACAFVQSPAAMDGEWGAWITQETAVPRNARLVFRAGGSAWRTLARDSGNRCTSILKPMTWRRREGGGYEVHVHASQALAGCRDDRMVLKQIDARTPRGHSDAGGGIVLTRVD